MNEALPSQPQYWVMSDEAFLEALRRAAGGEDPDMVYAEYYANCVFKTVRAGDDDEDE